MDSLQEILGNKDFSAPDEVSAIRNYIKDRYQSSSHVKLEKGSVIISVPTSALAGTLRLEQRSLIEQCRIQDKKLIIRIGR